MVKIENKNDIEILENRGLWKASAALHKLVKRLARKKLSLELGYLKNAHKTIFTTAKQQGMAGKYRQDNPELKKINGSLLQLTHWAKIPNAMANLDFDLRLETKKLTYPKTEKDYEKIISLAAKLSHRFVCIHPFENGNGRISRLLINAILLRAGLPVIAIKKSKFKYCRALCQADTGDFFLLEDLIVDGLIEAKEKTYRTLEEKKHKGNK